MHVSCIICREILIARGVRYFVSQDRVSGCSDDDDDNDVETAFCMASLERSEGAGYDNSRSGKCVFSTTHVTYMWHNISVHTSGSKLRRRGFWTLRRSESTASGQCKRILRNGEFSLHRPDLVCLFSVIKPVQVSDSNRKSYTGCFFNAEMSCIYRAGSVIGLCVVTVSSVLQRAVPRKNRNALCVCTVWFIKALFNFVD